MATTKVGVTKEIVVPTVNLNGTSAEGLIEMYGEAQSAVEEAIRKVGVVWPHGRDYQTESDEFHGLAQEQHEDRLRRLRAVRDELHAIWTAVYDQPETQRQYAARRSS